MEFTLIEDGEAHALPATRAGARVRVAPEALEAALGWVLKPEGLCRGDVCVPVRDRDALLADGAIDLEAFASALGRPLALDAEEHAGAIGAATSDQQARLASLEAPDFTLPDLAGRMHTLSDHRGKKVLLIAYASW